MNGHHDAHAAGAEDPLDPIFAGENVAYLDTVHVDRPADPAPARQWPLSTTLKYESRVPEGVKELGTIAARPCVSPSANLTQLIAVLADETVSNRPASCADDGKESRP
jgi:hypothetical protein